MKKLLILSLLLCNISFAQEEKQLLDEIIAIVEDGVILRSELNRAVDNIIQQFKARGSQLPAKAELEKQVLERLIMQELQMQKADAAGVRISEAEIDKAMSQVAAQNKITLQQMQMALENDGMNFADFRNDMRKELKTEQIRNGLANQEVKISENEIDLFLSDNKLSDTEVHLGHLLVAVDAKASPQKVAETKAKADKLYEDLINGKDFADMATIYSAGQKAKEGGDLGWRTSSELPTLFADQLKAMLPGDITSPVRSASGFHIIKLIETRKQAEKVITQYHARHILIENSELVTPAQGLEIINEIAARLKEGEDFAKLAEEKSDDVNSAALGGDLDWFQLNEFGQRLGNALKKLDDNDISEPFQTQSGWHVLQRLAVRENDVTVEIEREKARKAIHTRKMSEQIESWLREIRGEAFVDIRI